MPLGGKGHKGTSFSAHRQPSGREARQTPNARPLWGKGDNTSTKTRVVLLAPVGRERPQSRGWSARMYMLRLQSERANVGKEPTLTNAAEGTQVGFHLGLETFAPEFENVQNSLRTLSKKRNSFGFLERA